MLIWEAECVITLSVPIKFATTWVTRSISHEQPGLDFLCWSPQIYISLRTDHTMYCVHFSVYNKSMCLYHSSMCVIDIKYWISPATNSSNSSISQVNICSYNIPIYLYPIKLYLSPPSISNPPWNPHLLPPSPLYWISNSTTLTRKQGCIYTPFHGFFYHAYFLFKNSIKYQVEFLSLPWSQSYDDGNTRIN